MALKRTRWSKAFFIAGWCSLFVGPTGRAFAAQGAIAVVVASKLGAYSEALAGALELLGPSTLVLTAEDSNRLPPEIGTVVAIGGKAALRTYPPDVQLVYCLAPGVLIPPLGHSKRSLKVYISPPPRLVLEQLRLLQPKVQRLGMLWISESGRPYAETLALQAKEFGITIVARRLEHVEDLPDALRSLLGTVDALWIVADPQLVNPQQFATLSQFSRSNRIPLYVPIAALAEKGAAAAVAVTFRSMGQKAGALAVELAAHREPDGTFFYGEPVTVTINAAAADQAGLVIEQSVQRRMERTIQ